MGVMKVLELYTYIATVTRVGVHVMITWLIIMRLYLVCEFMCMLQTMQP